MVICLLGGTVIMINIAGRPSGESVIVQQNSFPEAFPPQDVLPGDRAQQYTLGLLANVPLEQVELRYSFLVRSTELSLIDADLESVDRNMVAENVVELSWMLDRVKAYPLEPEITETVMEYEGEEREALIYDFSRFFGSTLDQNAQSECLTMFVLVFDRNGTLLAMYKGISSFLDEKETGMYLKSVTIVDRGRREMYFSGECSDDTAKPMEEVPPMGSIVFADVLPRSHLGIILDTEYGSATGRDGMQLVKIYVNGRLDRTILNPVSTPAG